MNKDEFNELSKSEQISFIDNYPALRVRSAGVGLGGAGGVFHYFEDFAVVELYTRDSRHLKAIKITDADISISEAQDDEELDYSYGSENLAQAYIEAAEQFLN